MATLLADGGYVDVESWTARYQRNNKRGGLKNLRCFPKCSDVHKVKGFCGHSIVLRVTRKLFNNDVDKTPLYSWAAFRREEGTDTVEIGAVVPKSHFDMDESSPKSTTRPLYSGAVKGGNEGRIGETVCFEFNQAKKGWNYSWPASKHTTNIQHRLVAYVFAPVRTRDDLFHVVGIFQSPAFSLYSRKRPSTPPPRLLPERRILAVCPPDGYQETETPPQMSLHKRPRSSFEHSLLTGPLVDDGATPAKLRRRLAREEIGLPDGGQMAKSGPSRVKSESDPIPAMFEPSIFDGEEREINSRLWRLMVVLERLESRWRQDTTGSCATGKKDNTMLNRSFGRETSKPPLPAPNGSSSSSSTSTNNPNNSLDSLTKFMLADLEGTSFVEDFSQVFNMEAEDDMGNWLNKFDDTEAWDFLSNLNTSIEPDMEQPGDTHVKPPHKPRSCSLSSEPSLEAAGTSTGQPVSDQLVKDLATFLIEEQSFTQSLHLALQGCVPGVSNTSTSQRKRAFTEVLNRQIGGFLAKYGMIYDDFDSIFGYEPPDQVIAYQQRATARFRLLHEYMKWYGENQSRQAKATKEFESANVKTESWNISNSHINLTGTWSCDETVVNALESIRQIRGVPWVLRKMLRFIDKRLDVRQIPGKILVRTNRKFLGGGYHTYILDGNDYPWTLPSPIPWNRPLAETCKAWIDNGCVKMMHVYDEAMRAIRVLRRISSTKLEVTIIFQQKPNPFQDWVETVKVVGYAYWMP